MAGFKFSLQSVLGVKEVIEAQKQRAFADAQRAVLEKEEAKAHCQGEVLVTIQALKRLKESEIEIKAVLSHQRYINSLRMTITRIDDQLIGLRQEMEKRREELIAASKERKALERLKERHREEWMREQDQLEQKQLDEMAIQRYTPDDETETTTNA